MTEKYAVRKERLLIIRHAEMIVTAGLETINNPTLPDLMVTFRPEIYPGREAKTGCRNYFA